MFDGRNGRQDDGGDLGFSKKVPELTGLAANDSRWSGPATFEFRRDAGVIRFNGRFEEGWGEGTYRFEGDSRFLKALDLAKAQDDRELEVAAISQCGRALLSAGRTEQAFACLDEAMAETSGDSDPRGDPSSSGLAALGYQNPPADKLIALRSSRGHAGVHPRLRAKGVVATDLDDLIPFRVHSVSPSFINRPRQAGLRSRPVPTIWSR
jgi:hypothetical protein